MAGDEEVKKIFGRKLTKKRREPSRPPAEVPEKFKYGDDAQDDVAAPKGANAQYMNQSVFSMIAAAGSKVDFNARFDDDSSDSEADTPATDGQGNSGSAQPSKDAPEIPDTKPGMAKHRRKMSENKLLKSLPKLNLRTIKERNYMSQSVKASSSPESMSPRTRATPREAPVMSQMLQAQAQLKLPGPLDDLKEEEVSAAADDDQEPNPTSALSKRLMEIFKFEKPERVISEYPCWLLKSVLLQGYMYITSDHICFYAYLPKKSNIVAKSGYLAKRGRQNPKYNRYWFTLKGDVLAYYLDPSDLYFPSGNIDLRYGIQASLFDGKDKSKDTKDFSVTTHQRTYWFRADSSTSAKEWVKTLQKVIFRSHNDGDSVKISLPIANVIDIEDSPVLEFADTFKVRVVDNDETYAVDEYFFSFFSFGKDAFNVLKILIDDSPAQRLSIDMLSPLVGQDGSISPRESLPRASRDASPRGTATPVLRDSVRATLSPVPISPIVSGRASPRSSTDFGRRSLDIGRELNRANFDRGRRSGSQSRFSFQKGRGSSKSPLPRLKDSSDSYVHSLDREGDLSTTNPSSDETQASASQILNRSDVFHSPTIQQVHRSASARERFSPSRGLSPDPRRVGPSNTEIRIHPPSRAQTQQVSRKPRPGAKNSIDMSSDTESSKGKLQGSSSSPALQDLVKAGSYPLQRAAGFADYLKNSSKRMSSLLATESMGYIEKVSGMWIGGKRHYDEAAGLQIQDPTDSLEDEDEGGEHGARFRAHFALPANEKLQATYFGYLHRVLPLYGKVYISNRSFCFRSLLLGTHTKMILPLKDIENVDKEKGFRFGYSGLVLVIRGHEELFFEFSQPEMRDDCAVTLLQNLEHVRYMKESGLLTKDEKESVAAAKAEHQMLQEARKADQNEHELKLPKTVESANQSDAPQILFDDPRVSIINFKPNESLRITCLTIGTRGDVQPYIALCKGLLKEGHRPKIATHAEYGAWVKSHGIEFATVDGDPAELMRICVENGMFTYSFLKEASAKFRGWIEELLSSAWKACQNTDILIESPSAMAGIHIAESLEIPYFRAFSMPWTRTRAYPHAFAVPEHKIGGAYNYFSYVMFDNVFWRATSGQINRWRKKELGLRSTNLDKLQANKVPFLYNFSPSVVVPPLDYSDWIRVTGYWFLDEASDWKPPKDLTDFIAKARANEKKIVYVGFGSIVVSDPAALTKTIVESVLKADVRCILSKGWSDRLGNKDAAEPEIILPDEILQIQSAPHDWLFKQIDAAAHHGGAGTTGASLRAGLPTIIKPFFGDQFFFGSRIEDLGVGIYIRKLNVSVFSRALWEVCHSERMIVKAKVLGEEIRQETGVDNAIQAIYRDLEYARTLIKKKGATPEDDWDDSEESWTFIGDDGDPELARRIAEWEPMTHLGRRSMSGNRGVRAVSPG